MEHKELPLPTVTVSEQVLSVFLLTIAQILSLLAFSISICSLFLYSFSFDIWVFQLGCLWVFCLLVANGEGGGGDPL